MNSSFTKKILLFLFFTLLLPSTLMAQSERKLIVRNNRAGSMEELFPKEKWDQARTIIISGPLNGTDIAFLRSLLSSGNVSVTLDMLHARIVSGGNKYYQLLFPNYTSSGIIGENMFRDCRGLYSIILPRETRTIEERAFSGCTSLRVVEVSDQLRRIEQSAFYGCSSLTTINLEVARGLQVIDVKTFDGCRELRTVAIPSSVHTIGRQAFNGTLVEKVFLPRSLKTLGEEAFQNSHLKTLDLPAGTTIAGNKLGNLPYLESVSVESGNANYMVEDGVLFTIDGLTLLKYPSLKRGNYAVRAGVQKIANGAFMNCVVLTSVVLPPTVTSIGENAFYYCKAMTNVNVPDAVTHIGEKAFYDCKSLSELIIPEGILSLGTKFAYGCKRLNRLVMMSPTPPSTKKVTDSKAVLYVPAGSVGAYQAADGWKKIKNIQEINF